MRVAILGGTGKLGLALARRSAAAGIDVRIGSRNADKAEAAALRIGPQAQGFSLLAAVEGADLTVLAVPYSAHRDVLREIGPALRGSVLVDATVPLDPDDRTRVRTVSGTSAAEEARSILGAGAEVYSAFHTVSHRVLDRPGTRPDVLLAGSGALQGRVVEWLRAVQVNPVPAGTLEVSGHLERMTALLISINQSNGVRESGLSVTGLAAP